MINLRYTLLICFVFLFSSVLRSQTRKERAVLDFIDARYNANLDSVRLFLDDDFIYYHIPYVGIGLSTTYNNGGLRIKGISPYSDAKMKLKLGDVINEVNGIKINNNKVYDINNIISGSIGDSVEIVYTRDGVTQVSKVVLSKQQFRQDSLSFLNDIKTYGNRWYEYELNIMEIFSKKNRFVVHYEWEGTLKEDGPTYHYRCMEIIKTNFSDNRIYSIEGLWTEKQFRDQFK